MALTYTRQLLSGSTNGRAVEISSTSSPGTTVHTCAATATTAREEVFLYCSNTATGAAQVSIEFGGTASADRISYTLNANSGLHTIIPGLCLTATSSIVRAFATATGVLHLHGYVNRAT